MKSLIAAVLLLLTGLAFAELELEVRVNRIEMSATAPNDSQQQTDETASSGSKAQGYNSSRSNRRGLSAPSSSIDHNASRSNTTRALDPDDDGDGLEAKSPDGGITAEDDWATPARAKSPGGGEVEDDWATPARASSNRPGNAGPVRSNGRARDTGGIKDGVEDKNNRCRTAGLDDDCDSAAATAVDHNTTRSNR
jgi:hypothetical protein